MKDVILHAFNWKYRDIIEKLEDIADSGFGAILISPPLYSDTNGDVWWQRYQPKDYRIILSYLGDKKDIENLLRDAHKKNIKIYADIILNHMANEDRVASKKLNFPGEEDLIKYSLNNDYYEKNKIYGDLSKGLFSASDFNEQINIQDWKNPFDVAYHQLKDLPDLKDNVWVLKQQRKLFYELKKMGFDGFRIDAIKHLSKKQINNIVNLFFLKNSFLFGEVLTTSEAEVDIFMKPFLSETHISAYDFPLQEQLSKAFKYKGSLKHLVDPFYYGKALHWSRAVTFTVNHDIPLNEDLRFLLLEPQDEFLANVYIFGRDSGLPLVYSDNNESTLENGHGKFHPEDKDRWVDTYKRKDIRAMIKFHNNVIGEPMEMLFEHDNFLIFRRGNKGIVAINKSNEWVHADISLCDLKNPGEFKELFQGYKMTFNGEEHLTLAIAPRSAQMWLG